MRRIQQKSLKKADCGIACVAMVTGSKYSDALRVLIRHKKNGEFYTRHKDLITAVNKLGLTANQKKFQSFRNITGIAIVAINKRADGCWHWVVFNGESKVPFIYDPKPNKKRKITNFRGLRGVGNYIQLCEMEIREMSNIKLSEEKAKEIETALSLAGYSSKDRDMCIRYFIGKGDSTYIHHSLNIVRANKNTKGRDIIQKFFGAPNGKASPSQNDTYDTWFFNGYIGKKGSSV